ncbi:MAG: lysophospholipid acyltransferase family protein [Chloroflexota bacterium]
MLSKFLISFVGWSAYYIGAVLKWLFLRVEIAGWENLPASGPLLIVSNHFSWFEAPLIILCLPFQVRFVVMSELADLWYFRPIALTHGMIAIKRGRIDRNALREIGNGLADGDVVGIFPEGGIDPELQTAVSQGESTQGRGQVSRMTAQLIPPRAGTALLATRSQVPILPIGFVGTEKVMGNLMRGRRTAVSMHIGKPFGPLTLPSDARGKAKRQQLEQLGHEMMQQIANLLPLENRGVYR